MAVNLASFILRPVWVLEFAKFIKQRHLVAVKSKWQTTVNSMKLVIPLHWLYWSIHTKDESKRGTAFAFIFGVN